MKITVSSLYACTNVIFTSKDEPERDLIDQKPSVLDPNRFDLYR